MTCNDQCPYDEDCSINMDPILGTLVTTVTLSHSVTLPPVTIVWCPSSGERRETEERESDVSKKYITVTPIILP